MHKVSIVTLKSIVVYTALIGAFSAHAEDERLRLTCTFVCNQSSVCDVKQLDPEGKFTTGSAKYSQLRKPLVAPNSNLKEIKETVGIFSLYASATRGDWERPKIKILNTANGSLAFSDMVPVPAVPNGPLANLIGSVSLGYQLSSDPGIFTAGSVSLLCIYRKPN